MPERAAIWDIDGTIISSSLERRFLAYLRGQGVLTDKEIARHFSTLLWRWRLPRWHLVKACYLRGMRVAEAERVMREFFESDVRSVIRSSVRDSIARLSQTKCRQLLLSGTLQPLAEMLANHLGVSDVIAAAPAVENETYTGELTSPVARGRLKAVLADEWLRRNGVDWQATLAVADHWGDRFLLKKAGTAVVVQPQGKLARLARRRGWHIIDAPDADDTFLEVMKSLEL